MKSDNFSTYHQFLPEQWRQFSTAAPVSLSTTELQRLSGVNEEVSMQEILQVYMPLTCLLQMYIDQAYALHRQANSFLQAAMPKVPYVIGIAGSVASGKSTTSRILLQLLSQMTSWTVKLVGTDGFLLPNAMLEQQDLMHRKGFPESYDLSALLQFLFELKSGRQNLKVPVYSHHQYDILADQFIELGQTDVLIIEGLNILQTGVSKVDYQRVFVSDFLDFTVFVDAPVAALRQWYIDRLLAFMHGPMQNPDAYFHHLTLLSQQEVVEYGERIWRDINEKNLINNILPHKYRSDCILQKRPDHTVANILLRKL